MVDQDRNPEPGPTPPPDPPPPGRDGPPPGGLQHPSVLYDHSDANFRWILWLILGSMVLAAVIFYVILVFYHRYADYEAQIKRSNYPMAPPSSGAALPPEPRLEQLSRMEGIKKGNVYLREEEKEEILNSYGSAGDNYVHIPIDRAMDALAGKLPARTPPTRDQARRQNGLVDAGESNSGRMFRGADRE
jgi:hypothetical protein